jgi:hypothetical protein
MKTKLELGKSVWSLVDNSFFGSVYCEVYSPVNKTVDNSLFGSVRSSVRRSIDESLAWKLKL